MQKRDIRHSVNVALPDGSGQRFERQLRHLLDKKAKESFKDSYLRSECFSKYLDEDAVPASVRADAAVAKWLAAERKNTRTNCHLQLFEGSLGWIEFEQLKTRIQHVIRAILGPLVYPGVLSGSSFTNGASTRVPRSSAASVFKLTGEMHMTEPALKHWLAMATGTLLSTQTIALVPGSVLFTVPKKSEIDRCACKEPEGNMLLQRSVGLYISRRLKRVGIDLSDQTVNQRLARDALRLGLATIDLSSASDTITQQLVFELLPFEWWSLLDDLRSHVVRLPDGSDHQLSMFSSMGNGFTFELETLIFYAITKVVVQASGLRGRISVYGDDIIAPSPTVPRLSRVLSLFGFTLNKKKTHHRGPFRESCGRHYWNGFDVTPFYIRTGVRTLPQLINALNHLLEWDGRGWGFFVDKDAYLLWNRWKDLVPPQFWGGIDPKDSSALVTGHRPRKRLVPILKRKKVPQSAALRSWLHRAEHLVRDESHLEVDPRDVIAFKAVTLESLGERSSWIPELIFSA